MECKNCKKEIADDFTLCPFCGTAVNGDGGQPVFSQEQPVNYQPAPAQQPKKSKKKLWIIIAVAAAVLILIIAAVSGGDDSTSSGTSGGEQTSASSETQKTSEVITNAYTQMKASQFYKTICESENTDWEFTVSDRAVSFIDENAQFFPCSGENLSALTSAVTDVAFKEITKSPHNFDNKIIKLSNIYVGDISEESDETGGITYLHVFDDDLNSYVGYYLSTLPGIYQDSYVDLYGVPLDVVYFDNVSNETTIAVMLAICYCEESNAQGAWEEPDADIDLLNSSPIDYFLAANPDAPYPCQVKTQTGSPLNLRAGRSTESEILTQLANGESVFCYGTYDGWAYVKNYESYCGWVSAEYLMF